MNDTEFGQPRRQVLWILVRNVTVYRNTTPTGREPNYCSIRGIAVVMDKVKKPEERWRLPKASNSIIK